MADSAPPRPLPADAHRCMHCSNANNRPQIHSQLHQTSAFGDSTSSMHICMTSVHASVHARHDGFPATPAKHADHCGSQRKKASAQMSDPAPPMAMYFHLCERMFKGRLVTSNPDRPLLSQPCMAGHPAEHADRNLPLLPAASSASHHRWRYSPTTVDERWRDYLGDHALLAREAARRNGAGGARSPPTIPASTCAAAYLTDACNSTCSSITRANDVISHHLFASALHLCIVHCMYAMANSAPPRPLPADAHRCMHCSNANNRPQIHSQLHQQVHSVILHHPCTSA